MSTRKDVVCLNSSRWSQHCSDKAHIIEWIWPCIFLCVLGHLCNVRSEDIANTKGHLQCKQKHRHHRVKNKAQDVTISQPSLMQKTLGPVSKALSKTDLESIIFCSNLPLEDFRILSNTLLTVKSLVIARHLMTFQIQNIILSF